MVYSAALADAQSRVRFTVYDVDDAAPLLPEATYLALLAKYEDDEDRATVAAAEAIIARISRDPDKVEVTGAVKVEWANRLAVLRALANGLRAQLGLPILGAADSTLYVGQFVRSTDTSSEFGG